MSCAITALDQTLKACINAIGGLQWVSFALRGDITAATVAAGQISAFTGGTWVPFFFDRDKSSFLTSAPNRPTNYLFYHALEAFMKFSDPTDADIVAMNNIVCCDIVAVAKGNNGRKVVIGIQINVAGDDIEEPFQSARVNPVLSFPAGDEESQITYSITSQQTNIPVYTGTDASVGVT